MKKLLIIFFALFALTAQAERVPLQLTGQQGDNTFFFTVPKSHASNKEYLTDRAKTFCYGRTYCYVHFWQTGEAAPRKFPLTDKEVELELAQYRQNLNTGLSVIIFNCKRFPGTSEKECFTP